VPGGREARARVEAPGAGNAGARQALRPPEACAFCAAKLLSAATACPAVTPGLVIRLI